MPRAPLARRFAAQPPWAWTESCQNDKRTGLAQTINHALHTPELGAQLRAAGQQVVGVGQRREQRRRQTVIIHSAAKAQDAIAVIEVGGVAVVETGEGQIASHAPKFDVVLAVEAAQLGGVSIVQHKAAE